MARVDKEKVDALYNEFNQIHSYCVIDRSVVEKYLKRGFPPSTDLLLDYVLSNDLAEEVVL